MCHPPDVGSPKLLSVGARSEQSGAAPSQCESLSPVATRLTDPNPDWMLQQEAAVSATLLALVPVRTSENMATAMELSLVMVQQGARWPNREVDPANEVGPVPHILLTISVTTSTAKATRCLPNLAPAPQR